MLCYITLYISLASRYNVQCFAKSKVPLSIQRIDETVLNSTFFHGEFKMISSPITKAYHSQEAVLDLHY